jgi:hypothetical protein
MAALPDNGKSISIFFISMGASQFLSRRSVPKE